MSKNELLRNPRGDFQRAENLCSADEVGIKQFYQRIR